MRVGYVSVLDRTKCSLSLSLSFFLSIYALYAMADHESLLGHLSNNNKVSF